MGAWEHEELPYVKRWTKNMEKIALESGPM